MEFSAYAQKELLNWDHEVNPTSLGHMALNIHDHLVAFGGFAPEKVRVYLDKDTLIIEIRKSSYFPNGSSFGTACPPYWKRVVHASLDGVWSNESTGRVGQWIPINVYTLSDYAKRIAA